MRADFYRTNTDTVLVWALLPTLERYFPIFKAIYYQDFRPCPLVI